MCPRTAGTGHAWLLVLMLRASLKDGCSRAGTHHYRSQSTQKEADAGKARLNQVLAKARGFTCWSGFLAAGSLCLPFCFVDDGKEADAGQLFALGFRGARFLQSPGLLILEENKQINKPMLHRSEGCLTLSSYCAKIY